MLPFKLIYSDGYYLPIGQHVFPAQKYRLIYQRLISTGLAEQADFLEPKPAADKDILLVHTSEYVYRLQYGMLSAAEELQMEIPYSEELVDAFWLAAGGSILAANQALQDRVAFNIGGGFHHAFPNHGEGFCMIHDVAVAIRRMQKDGKIKRAMTVDCDVHQGNGTAAIFGNRQTVARSLPSWGATVPEVTKTSVAQADKEEDKEKEDVFTISLHQANNYPMIKPPSSIDVNLPDHTTDDQYLAWLDNALSSGLRQFTPDLLCYVAGADPYKDDQLGGLDLTIEGLKKRDEMVFQAARAKDIPVMVTYAGGYAKNVEDTITIHCNTIAAAKGNLLTKIRKHVGTGALARTAVAQASGLTDFPRRFKVSALRLQGTSWLAQYAGAKFWGGGAPLSRLTEIKDLVQALQSKGLTLKILESVTSTYSQ